MSLFLVRSLSLPLSLLPLSHSVPISLSSPPPLLPQVALTETVSVGNMGVAKRGPVIEARDRLLLEYTDGSAGHAGGLELRYATRIHLACSRGSVSSGPRFLTEQNCTANFLWETSAACAIRTTSNDSNVSRPGNLDSFLPEVADRGVPAVRYRLESGFFLGGGGGGGFFPSMTCVLKV